MVRTVKVGPDSWEGSKVTEQNKYKYRVFLACSAADRAFGEWLHARLEDYRSQKTSFRLWGSASQSTSVGPVYFDCARFEDDMVPCDRAVAALQCSQFLLVICSSAAAKSARLNSEVRRFRRMGRADRVLPVLAAGQVCEGEPGCLPPELGLIVGEREALGRRRVYSMLIGCCAGKAKTIAVRNVITELLGHGYNRATSVRAKCRRRLIIRQTLGAALIALAFAFDHGMVFARYEISQHEKLLNIALAQVTALTRAAVGLSTSFGLPSGLSVKMVQAAETLLDDIAGLGRDTPSLRQQKASARSELADLHRLLSDGDSLAGEPALALADALRMGDVLRLDGKLDEASESYSAAKAIADALFSADRSHVGAQRGLTLAYFGLGEVMLLQGRPDEALASYQASNEIAQRLAAQDATRTEWQHDVGISHDRIGSLLEARQDVAGALAEYRSSLDAANALQAADPHSAVLQHNLALAHGHVGDILYLMGDLAGALQAYEARHAIIAGLVAANTPGSTWRNDLGASHARVGLVLEMRNDLSAAAREYEACLAIARRLGAVQPDDAGAQLNIAISYRRLAEVHHRLGSSKQALHELQQGRDVMIALIENAPELELAPADVEPFTSRIEALQGRASKGLHLDNAAELGAMPPPTLASAGRTSRPGL
jgi:tetratricopeptide (TPR) repeat protein